MMIVQLGSLRGQVLVASQAGDLEIYRCHVKTGSATPFQMLKQKLGSIQVKPWAALLPEEKGFSESESVTYGNCCPVITRLTRLYSVGCTPT